MKLSLEAVAGFNQIHSYDENEIVIRLKHQTGLESFKTGFLLSPDQIIADWSITDVQQLRSSDLMLLQRLAPEIVIFVTKKNLNPQMQLAVQPLTNARIGVEFMALGPACRTFNLLVSEQRKVLLAVAF